MALAKLTILVEDRDPIEAMFNPNQITIQKTVNWQDVPTAQRDSPAAQFTHGDRATLTLDLFFDTYETGADVRDYTDDIAHLATVEQHGDLHRPPICRLVWGRYGEFFKGVLQGLTQRFTLFLPTGMPVRATLGCTFAQWRSDEEDRRRQGRSSVDVTKTRTVRRGDTLSSIAGEEYRDPTLWRPIAEANGIDDPRVLQPGRSLVIPALQPVAPTGGGRR
ncbi:MAG: LysM peptidoglycan-binding domain-containing protein [Chloroflexota bacterium]|nr:LysM peptidoglycan-binding domain-containing protein [Chloroflexota bacterium]